MSQKIPFAEQAKIRLFEKAHLLLKDPTKLKRLPGYHPILRLWQSGCRPPSLKAWFICVPKTKNTEFKPFLIRRILWDCRVDFQKVSQSVTQPIGLDDFHPTCIIQDGHINRELIQLYLEQVRFIQIPFIAHHPIILDASMCGVEDLKAPGLTGLTWSARGPREWKPLVDWFDEMIAILENEKGVISSK